MMMTASVILLGCLLFSQVAEQAPDETEATVRRLIRQLEFEKDQIDRGAKKGRR